MESKNKKNKEKLIIVSRFIKDHAYVMGGICNSKTDYENFGEIKKAFGKQNCFQIKNNLFVVLPQEILRYKNG